MSKLRLVKATQENWEEAYDVFYRALRKLISEGKGNYFGGMTPEGVEKSMKGENRVYLVFREHDEMPVAAISILKQDDYSEYESILKEGQFDTHNVCTLNAMAVRPELWGQGYARQALRLCVNELTIHSTEVLVGTVHPKNDASCKTLKYASKAGKVELSLAFTMKTPSGRLLERRRFAFAI